MQPGSSRGPAEKLSTVIVAVIVVTGAVASLVPVGVGTASAGNATTIEGTPHLDASAPDARLDPGQNGAVSISLTNDATYDDNNATHPAEARARAGEARSVSVNISDTRNAPLTVETGAQSVGTIQDGDTGGPYSFSVLVDEDAQAGTYEMEVTTEYRHAKSVTYEEVADGEYAYNETVVNRTETDTVTVEIQPEARFGSIDVSHDVPIGGEGTITMEMTNTGDEDVTEATVSLTSSDSDFYFGSGTATSEANVGTWNAGETRTLEFRAGTVDSAVARSYPIDVSVSYTDSEGNQQTDSESIGITPDSRTEFTIEEMSHDVPRNGEGTVSVTVSHTAGKDLSEVTVTASTSDSAVYIGSESSPSSTTLVDNWGAGDERKLTFRVGTSASAVARSYPIELEFQYTDAADNDNSRTEVIEFTPEDRDRFAIDVNRHDVPQNGEGTLTLALENTLDSTVSDVSVTATTDDPAVYFGRESSRSSSTIIEKFDGGTQRELTFRVGTTADAVDRVYPIQLQVEYTDDANNDNTQSETIEFRPTGRDQFHIENVAHDVPQDGVGTVTVLAENRAGKDLSDVSVTASTPDSEIYIGSESSRSGTATVSEWGAETTRRLTFRVGATANAVNRSYPLNLQFEYTDAADNDNQWSSEVEFRPDLEPQFVVESVDHDVPVGSSGRVTLTLRNAGPVNATEAVLTASSQADAMFFGTGGAEPVEVQGVSLEPPQTGTPTAQTYVGDWPVGATRTVSVRAGFDGDAIVRDYVANLAIGFENENGDEMPERTRSIGIEPLPEQRFAFDRVESDLYVGEEGDLVVAVTNTADRTVNGLVVTAATQDQNVNFYNTRYAVGRLEPGESATVRYRVGITEEAEHGPRIFELSTRYRDPQADVRQTDSRDVTVDIGRDRNALSLERTDGTFAPGESGPLTVTVTNRRDETLSNVQAKLFTDDPLDSDDDSAFIPELEPGESRSITLDLSVGSGASKKTYSASMDFRFDNARGESELSDTYRVPVVVEQSDSSLGVGSIVVIVGLVLVFAVLGWRFGTIARIRAFVGRFRKTTTADESE